MKEQKNTAAVGVLDKPDKSPAGLALHAARHELTTLHGLLATDRLDVEEDPDVNFRIDTSESVRLIDRALSALECSDSRPS